MREQGGPAPPTQPWLPSVSLLTPSPADVQTVLPTGSGLVADIHGLLQMKRFSQSLSHAKLPTNAGPTSRQVTSSSDVSTEAPHVSPPHLLSP